MASTIKDIIKVDSLGKWGPKVGNEYYSWSKSIKEADKGKVVPGGEYEMELYIADSGKRYINSVSTLGQTDGTPKPLAKTPVKETQKAPINTGKPPEMTRADWDAKDRRISRQGCIQVAVQVTANFDEAVALAEKMLGFVNG